MMRTVGEVALEPMKVTRAPDIPMPPVEVLPRREEVFGEFKPFEPFTLKERFGDIFYRIKVGKRPTREKIAEEMYAIGITGKIGYPIYKTAQQVFAKQRVKLAGKLDPFLMIGAGLTAAGLRIGAKWGISRLPVRTKTFVKAEEIARVDEKSIFDIEAWTKVKPFWKKPQVIKIKGIAEAKQFKELVYTRAELKAITPEKEVPIIVKGIAKVKDKFAFGIDISKIRKDIFTGRTLSIKVLEKDTKQVWAFIGETGGKRFRRTKDIGLVAVKQIRPEGVDFSGAQILKQISKITKGIVKPEIITKQFDYLLPPVLKPKLKPPRVVPITKVKDPLAAITGEVTRVKPAPLYEPAFYQREELGFDYMFGKPQIQQQKQLQKQRQIDLQVQRAAQIQQQKQLQKQMQIPKVAPRLAQRQVQRQALAPALGLGLIQVPKLAFKPLTPMLPTPRKAPPRIVPKPPIPPLLYIPRKEETKTEKKRRKRAEAITRRQRFAYQASVGAVALGITAPKVPRDILTGLELRPVIRARRKKGAKRKKRKSYSNNYLNNLNKILR